MSQRRGDRLWHIGIGMQDHDMNTQRYSKRLTKWFLRSYDIHDFGIWCVWENKTKYIQENSQMFENI